MTEYETREMLKSIKPLVEKYVRKVEQVAELRAVAQSCTVRTDKECVQSSGSADKMASIVGRIVELDIEIEYIEQEIHSLRRLVTVMADKLSDDRHSQYIKTRYVDCNGFYDTIMILDLSESTARRIDRKAISEITTLINEKKHKI